MTSGEPAALLVTLHAEAGCRARLREALATVAGASRADAGCLRYDVLHDVEDADRFVLWEEWLDERSLVEHNTRPHVERFREACAELLAVPLRVQRLRRSA